MTQVDTKKIEPLNGDFSISPGLIAKVEELLDEKKFLSIIKSNWNLTGEGLKRFKEKLREINKEYNEKHSDEKKNYGKAIKEILQDLKDGDKLYFLYEYIGILIERGESARANSILSLVFSSLKKENDKDKMRTIGMFTQQNIESKYLLGDYKYLKENEEYIFSHIDELKTLILDEKYFNKKLVYIENLSCLVIVFSLYLINIGKTEEVENLIIGILNLQKENSVDKYFFRLQSKLTQLYIKTNKEEKAKNNFSTLKNNLGIYKTKNFSLQNFKLDENDESVFLITELELLIKFGGSSDDILYNIEKLSNIENIDYDNKIKFEYLKGLYFYNLSRNHTNLTSTIKRRIEAIILQEKYSEDLEIPESRNFLEESKTIIQNLLKDFKGNENKTFFIDSLILLSEIEKDKEISTLYFFQAWNFNRDHFGEDYQKSVYFRELLVLGKKLFPNDEIEYLLMRVRLHNLEKQEQIDKSILLENLGNETEDIQKILEETFGIEELLIYQLGGEEIQICSMFEKFDGCKKLKGKSGTKCALLQGVKEKLNSEGWKKIFDTEDIIELINFPYYSKTLVGILINVGPEYFLALVGKGENNSTDFTESELLKIPIYLREIFLKDIIKKYNAKIALEKKKREIEEALRYKLIRLFTHDLSNIAHILEGIVSLAPEIFGDLLEEMGYSRNQIEEIVGLRDYLEILGETNESLGFMLKNIKELLKPSNKVEEKRENYLSVDIVEILNKVVKMQRASIKLNQKNLEIIFLGGNEIFIKGLKSEFKLIFDNIIQNAIKCSDNGGIIRVEIEKIDNKLIIKVQDDGVGMVPKHCKEVFNYEAQAGSELLRSQGTGLGLSIVNKLAKKYGGEVSLFSEGEGKGATVTVSFPLEN